MALVLPGLESAEVGNRDGFAFGHLAGDHIQDAVKRVADVSPGETPWASPAGHLVYQVSFVHHSLVCRAFSSRDIALLRRPTR